MQTLNNLNINTAVATGSVPCSLQLVHAGLDAQTPGQTAADAVLFNPELLCNIVSQLPLEAIVITSPLEFVTSGVTLSRLTRRFKKLFFSNRRKFAGCDSTSSVWMTNLSEFSLNMALEELSRRSIAILSIIFTLLSKRYVARSTPTEERRPVRSHIIPTTS